MNNRDRYDSARFTVSTRIEDAEQGRASPFSPGFEFAMICAVLALMALIVF